jgi:hypothetical protein
MTERAYRYGDPAKVIEMEESRTCKGCINLTRLWGLQCCLKDNKAHERRCQSYFNPTERGTHGAS